MKIVKGLDYTASHEWVKWIDDSTARIGITDHAQESLGDIVYINLPEVGSAVATGAAFGDIESVKAVSDLYSPVSGEVTKVNEALIDAPEKLNEDAFANWIIEVGAITAKGELMDAEAYEKSAGEE